ncbi:MAG: MFS transporter [Oscillospiraceae bacterium]|jgi:Na+/melibiose symporter-like transporter|nr:MFS transporter [Oscillospiraceae bacterium]
MNDLQTGIHRAKTWQTGLFALNNTAVNIYYMMMTYMSYYTAGVLGLGVALVSAILTAFNIFDGITDPVIGLIMDRTSGKFGKFRPFMAIGNTILAFDLALFFLCQFAGGFKLPLLLVCFVIYDIGYTFQFDVTRAAQTVLTNDPKQRPVFSAFDMVLNIILYVGVSMAVSNYLVPKHGEFTAPMFGELFVLTAVSSAVCTVLAIIGIRAKDRPEYYGAAPEKAAKVKLRDCVDVLLHNKNVVMLMLSAATDKLFSNVTTNAVVVVMVFGIICGNYELSGQMNMFVFAPSMVISLLCVWYARRKGQKKALLHTSVGAIAANLIIFCAFLFGEPTTLSFSAWGIFTVVFYAGLAFRGGFMSVGNSIIVPMIGDCADYEVYRTGKYIPGMIGGLFSFADKIVTSLNSLIVGALVIAAGYGSAFPAVTTPYSRQIFIIAMICFCGLPAVGWLVNLIALHRYDLTPERMAEIRKASPK